MSYYVKLRAMNRDDRETMQLLRRLFKRVRHGTKVEQDRMWEEMLRFAKDELNIPVVVSPSHSEYDMD